MIDLVSTATLAGIVVVAMFVLALVFIKLLKPGAPRAQPRG